MTCRDFMDQVDAWVLDALEPDEAAACEAHIESGERHEGCIEALAHAREAAAALADTLPVQRPSPKVWAAIQREIGGESPARMPRRERYAWMTAAAAMLLVSVFGWELSEGHRKLRDVQDAANRALATMNADLDASRKHESKIESDRKGCERDLDAMKGEDTLRKEAVALLEVPGTRVVTLAGESYKASAIVNVEAGRAYVVSSAMVSKPGSVFELWILRKNAAPQPAGFLKSAPDGAAVGEFDRKLLAEGGAPEALAVSIEPAGGRPTPTQVILVGQLKS